MSPELACVPLDNRYAEEQGSDRAEPEKNSKRQQHLHVSPARTDHQKDADERTSENTDKDRQDRESPTEISADHEHHLHVAESHRFDAAQFFPGPTHQPERTAAY